MIAAREFWNIFILELCEFFETLLIVNGPWVSFDVGIKVEGNSTEVKSRPAEPSLLDLIN
jgi:hypothetical protein